METKNIIVSSLWLDLMFYSDVQNWRSSVYRGHDSGLDVGFPEENADVFSILAVARDW